ncbi:MAG: DMT family transporter [Rhodobacteraceae bacterium]|nr:DMT family transporter [Paracoccaceae bacterium]
MTAQGKGHLAMLLFSALVAGSFALGVLVANDMSPAALTTVRFWIATGVIGAAVLATTGVNRIAMGGLWRFPLLGAIYSSYFVLMFEGLKTAPAVSAAAVFTLTPILSGIFGWLLLRQVTGPRMAIALAIGATGALWVIFQADLNALLAFEIGRGEAIYFVGCISHAIYIPLLRMFNRGENALVFTFGVLISGSLALTLYSWSDLTGIEWSEVSWFVWMTIGYLAVFASAATFVLVQFAALRLPAAKVMAYTYLTPSWVICWELAMGNGVPPSITLVGVGFTVVALLLLLRDEEQPVHA